MPELPEVEVLVRHLRPLLRGETISRVRVGRARVIRPTPESILKGTLQGAKIRKVTRRGKYLLFEIAAKGCNAPVLVVGHLGMTGRMYVQAKQAPLPKHAAVVLELGNRSLIFEDTRYFGRLTLDTAGIRRLGPEPLGAKFTPAGFAASLARSAQAIKVKLLDQSIVAGVGNIYASEALFQARIAPTLAARKLKQAAVGRLHTAIRKTLRKAIEFGSTVRLNYGSGKGRDKLFYYGSAAGTEDLYEERLLVYDRAGLPCRRCGTKIKRVAQAGRSTYFCPNCQRRGKSV